VLKRRLREQDINEAEEYDKDEEINRSKSEKERQRWEDGQR